MDVFPLWDSHSFIRRRCYACTCLLRFMPCSASALPDPEGVWWLGSVCPGCKAEQIQDDSPHSFAEAEALAHQLSAPAETTRAQEEALHWETAARKRHQRDAATFRRSVRQFCSSYASSLTLAATESQELLRIPAVHPQHQASLLVYLHQRDFALHWGNLGWTYSLHPRTIRALLGLIHDILADQILTCNWYTNEHLLAVSDAHVGQPLGIPHCHEKTNRVALLSWHGFQDRVLQHPEETKSLRDGEWAGKSAS